MPMPVPVKFFDRFSVRAFRASYAFFGASDYPWGSSARYEPELSCDGEVVCGPWAQSPRLPGLGSRCLRVPRRFHSDPDYALDSRL